MSTPTPRTDAAWASSFEECEYRAAHTARTMRECSQQLETELTTLTAERDHWQKIAVSASHEREHNANVAQAMTAERDQLRVDLELADVMYQRECEVEHELRTEVERLRSDRDCEKRLRKDADEFRENAIERATKAEAELADQAVRFHDEIVHRQRTVRANQELDLKELNHFRAELAAERARLDSGQILLTVAGERVWHCGVDLRAAIDAGMREGAK